MEGSTLSGADRRIPGNNRETPSVMQFFA
jgi:hypothetical protein